MMKVLFHAYNCCFQNVSGGVQVRIEEIKKLLESNGITVDYFSPHQTKIKDYDILHVFMLNTETLQLISFAKSVGVKVVLSSIVSIKGGNTIAFWCRFPIIPTIFRQKYSIVQKCDAIISETPAEAKFIHKYYKASFQKLNVIPNGVEELGDGTNEIFDLLGKVNPYALIVGRFDENKNQLNVIRALRGANYDVVFIGGVGINGPTIYYNQCVNAAEGYSNIHFLGWLPSNSKELNSAYKNAHAVLLPSHHETFGLVATEGAMSGAHVCLSKTIALNSFDVFDKNKSFDPDDIHEIRRVVDKAMSIPKGGELKDAVKQAFSWNVIVKQHIDIYNKLLNE